MAERFRLQFLLRLYEALERREELKFAAVTRELVRARQSLEANEQARAELRGLLESSVEAGVPAAELEFRRLCAENFAVRSGELKRAADEIVPRQSAQREQLLVARRKRESLELLRRQQAESARAEELRREQAQLDEIVLMRRRRERA